MKLPARSAPEPKEPKGKSSLQVQFASKYAALSVDGEDENEGEVNTK